MERIDQTRFMLKSVTIYRDVIEDELISMLLTLMGRNHACADDAAELYSRMVGALYESDFPGNLADYIYDKVLYAENHFTLECARGCFDDLPEGLKAAARRDLQALSRAAYTSAAELKGYLQELYPSYAPAIAELPEYSSVHAQFHVQPNWERRLELFGRFCDERGYGRFSRYKAFYLDADGCEPTLRPVLNPDDISLEDLKGYEMQQKVIMDNTLALVRGLKANNMLLYGDRGTGKSSTVKAIANELCDQGLRLVEVSKENLKYLGRVIDLLAKVPMKFIVFTDDLTFADGDDSYTAMKAVLEGSSNKLADNMALYATTNRRHLVTETFSSRQGDEVHLKDTLDEAASLADRFGITVTFSSPGKDGFMEIVHRLAEDVRLDVPEAELDAGAVRWSARRGSFSPRTARQYIDYMVSQKAQGL